MTPHKDWGPGGFTTMKARLEREGYLSRDDLAAMLDANPGAALPPELHYYLIGVLRGEIRGKPGRRRDRSALRELKLHYASAVYTRALGVFRFLSKRRKASFAKRGGTPPRGDEAPHELALEYAASRVGMNPRSLYNELFRRDRLPGSERPAEQDLLGGD